MTAVSGGYTEVPVIAPATVEEQPLLKVYKRRWVMLAIFMVYSMGNSSQWLEYASITNVVTKFYNVSSYAVDWTAIVFMFVYSPLVFPASYLVNKIGLRKCILIGAGMTALGSWVKCASISPELYWVTMVGQTIVAIAQVFMLQLPPEVASVWFGSDQVSTACSLGVFGNQAGLALSFLLIPIAVRNHPDMADVGSDLARMSYVVAGFNTAVFILVITLFQDKPPLPPSIEVAKKIDRPQDFIGPLRRLFRNTSFILLIITYSLNLSVFNAFSTLLNQLILIYFEDGQEFAGRVGLLFIVGGMLGSIVCGIILDKTHRFKETTIALYILSAISLIATTFLLGTRSHTAIYITGGIFGACIGGYMPVSLEFTSEITYPEPEGTTAGILLAGSAITGVPFTMAYAWLIKIIGDVWANVAMTVILIIGTGLTALIKSDLRRQAAHAATINKEEENNTHFV
ncbi:heme transporter FLVCR2 [Anabrus simplex]|uniref:heme transporter FLVCR2 n=1 Tax=Anabrus simplex TaxID=316456 RepID=UPI0035A35F68